MSGDTISLKFILKICKQYTTNSDQPIDGRSKSKNKTKKQAVQPLKRHQHGLDKTCMDVFFILLTQHWIFVWMYNSDVGWSLYITQDLPCIFDVRLLFIFHLQMTSDTYNVNIGTENYIDDRLRCWETHANNLWYNKCVMSSNSNGVYGSQSRFWHYQLWQSIFDSV